MGKLTQAENAELRLRRLTLAEISKLMGYSTRHIREMRESMQGKGYGVLSDSYGLCKTDDPELKRQMGIIILARANKHGETARRIAEGLVRKDKGELTEQENILWQILPKAPDSMWSNTFDVLKFEPIDINDLL